MKNVLLFLTLSLTFYSPNILFSQSCTITATQSGTWKTPAVWGGAQPAAGDVICIPNGITVTIPNGETINLAGAATIINVLSGGTLVFGNPNTNIIMNSSSVVNWYEGGNINTNTQSNLFAIRIGSTNYSHSQLNALGSGVVLSEGGSFPLPVELTDFNGSATPAREVFLWWKTASELNNAGFQLQRSSNARTWIDIAFLEGYGTTAEEQHYRFTDPKPQPGLNYYRLKQLDYDGAFVYSKIISVDAGKDENSMRLFPNPAVNFVSLTFAGDYFGEATLTLFDLTGRQMKTRTLSMEGGIFRTDIEVIDLPAGIYLASLQAGSRQWQQRLVVK